MRCYTFKENIYIDLKSSKIFYYDRLWDDYLIWEKYQHLFPIKNYFFRVYKSIYSHSHYSFIFINKKACLKKIQDNLNLFKRKLGNSISPEKILLLLETKDNLIEDVFQGNEDLLGILLGFGKHNSLALQKKIDLEKEYPPPFDADKINKMYNVKLTGFPDEELDNPLVYFILLPYFWKIKIILKAFNYVKNI